MDDKTSNIDSEHLESRVKSRRGTSLGLGATVLSAILGLNCVSEEQAAYSNWPRPKRFVGVERQHYTRHVDDLNFSFLSERRRRVMEYLGFEGSSIDAEYSIGRQKVVRLKKGCGASNHDPNCITKSILSEQHAPDKALLMTVRDRTLEGVIVGDDVSCIEIKYVPGDGFDKEGPRLSITTYRVREGRVVNPVQKDGHGTRERRIRYWNDIIYIHEFLMSQFGRSILTEDQVFEAEYFADREKGAKRLLAFVERINDKRYVKNKKGDYEYKYIFLVERASELADFARRYNMIVERDSTLEADRELNKVRESMQNMYKTLLEELGKDLWQEKTKGRKDEERRSITISLESARRYLNETK